MKGSIGYLLMIENLLRGISHLRNEKYADDLRINFFQTIYEVIHLSGNKEKIDIFKKKYDACKDCSFSELEEQGFYFEDLIEDLKDFI